MNDTVECRIRCCVLIPAFREQGRIGGVVGRARASGADVVVIDDGSPDACGAEAEAAGAIVLRHPVNRGKGAALQTGFDYARREGYDVAITMDADGQHDPAEIPAFLEAYARTRIPVLIGNRMADAHDMPWVRRTTNRTMSRLLGRVMNQYIPDTQCGYRLYRCDILPLVATDTTGFAAESEVLLKLAERGVRMDSVRIRTIYGSERSKIRPCSDTLRFVGMLLRHQREQRRSRRGRRVTPHA